MYECVCIRQCECFHGVCEVPVIQPQVRCLLDKTWQICVSPRYPFLPCDFLNLPYVLFRDFFKCKNLYYFNLTSVLIIFNHSQALVVLWLLTRKVFPCSNLSVCTCVCACVSV